MANTTGPITRLPIWRYDGPLLAAAQTLLAVSASDSGSCADDATVLVMPAAGFFASQQDDLSGPYYRYRPYLWHRGALVSPGVANSGSGLISASDFSASAEDITNVLLANLTSETGIGAEAATNLLLAGVSSETSSGSDAAGNLLLDGLTSETGSGADAAPNLLLAPATESGTATDFASVVITQIPVGFFASQGITGADDRPGPQVRLRPYWRYDGPLLAAATGAAPVQISVGDTATAAEAVSGVLLTVASETGSGSEIIVTVNLSGLVEIVSAGDNGIGLPLGGVILQKRVDSPAGLSSVSTQAPGGQVDTQLAAIGVSTEVQGQ